MAKTDPINTANPSGDSQRSLGDDYIRTLADAVVELINVDHFMDAASPYSSDACGEHLQVTFNEVRATPDTVAADKGMLYLKDDTLGELHFCDESENETQITKSGKVYLDGAFLANGAVLGLFTEDTADDESFSIAAASAAAVGRGASISLYGNNHATKPGQIELVAGYSGETTDKAIINASSSLISNVLDPVSDQDAVTKKALDTRIGATDVDPTLYEGGESVTLPNGLILKMGKRTDSTVTKTTTHQYNLEFDTAFPNAIISFNASGFKATADYAGSIYQIMSMDVTDVEIQILDARATEFYWIAIGY